MKAIKLTVNVGAVDPFFARYAAFRLSEKLSRKYPQDLIEVGVKDTGSTDSVILHESDVLYSAADLAEDMQ